MMLSPLLYRTLILGICWWFMALPMPSYGQKNSPQLKASASTWRLDSFTQTLPLGKIPPRWNYYKVAPLFGRGSKQALVSFVHNTKQHYIRMRAGSTDFFAIGVKSIETAKWPVLEWSWQVVRTPRGGNVLSSSKNDQAGAVCLYHNISPLNVSEGMCYLWENTTQKNKWFTTKGARIIVLRNVTEDATKRWYREKRNLAEDYRRVFKRSAPKTLDLALQIDANSTESGAEVLYRNLVLHRQ